MLPKWTVFSNISGKFIGKAWEFFETEAEAQTCYVLRSSQGWVASMRPYHPNDFQHLHILLQNEIVRKNR